MEQYNKVEKSGMVAMFIIAILLSLVLYTDTFGQLIVDSTAVEQVSNDEDWFWGKVHYEGDIPNVNDYQLGFLYSGFRDELNFVPAGWFNHNVSAKTITYRTEMGNLPDIKIWVRAYVYPKTTTSKFEIGGVTYFSQNKYWYYDIYQEPYIESDLPIKKIGYVGETVTFTIYATGQSLNYEWFRRTMNPDTTWNDPVVINGETSSEYTTPALQLSWNGWKVFCRIYNGIGEAITRQSLLRVYE